MEIRTQTHLTALRDLLAYRRQELQADVRGAEEARAAGDGPGAEEQRDRAELARVDAAFERLDHGTYGDCLDCGCAIPLQRLMLQPAAERCAACQARAETTLHAG